MAKIKFKNLKGAFKNISKEFDKFLNDENEARKIARTLRSENVINLRKEGKDANDKKLPELEESTIKARKRIAKYNKTASGFSPARSNVTIIGRFVRSIKAEAGSKSTFFGFGKTLRVFNMFFSGNHKPYERGFTDIKIAKSGRVTKKRRKSVPNATIAKGIVDNPKWNEVKFLGATKRAKERIVKQFRRYIRRRRR